MQRILIVDDSATMRSMLVSTLESLDAEVEIDAAPSGFDALRMLPRARYDLIVTDINMPDVNGLELISFVKRTAAYRSIAVIVVTTEGSERDRQKALELGAQDYVVKPFEPGDLCQRVLEGLECGAPPVSPRSAATPRDD